MFNRFHLLKDTISNILVDLIPEQHEMTTVPRCLIFSPLLRQNHSPGCSSDSSRRSTNPLPDRPRLLLHIDVAKDADDDRSYLLVCCDHEVPPGPLGSMRGAIVATNDLGETHLLDP